MTLIWDQLRNGSNSQTPLPVNSPNTSPFAAIATDAALADVRSRQPAEGRYSPTPTPRELGRHLALRVNRQGLGFVAIDDLPAAR